MSLKQEVQMELYCEQERLAAALKAVLRADGHLSVIATDCEMTIRR